MIPIFITGIGTGVGKTIISAIVTQALQADYWKPIQAGFADGTDSDLVQSLVGNSATIHPEVYKLQMPASPHIAAQQQGVTLKTSEIVTALSNLKVKNKYLVVEGAGGLMVPLNETEFVADLIVKLDATCILVSRNYLGSINHSLLTAAVCQQKNIKTAGWIFNDQYLDYEQDIVRWSKMPALASIPNLQHINSVVVSNFAAQIRDNLLFHLEGTQQNPG